MIDINLLPQEEVVSREQREVGKNWVLAVLLVTSLFLVVVGGVLGYQLILEGQKNSWTQRKNSASARIQDLGGVALELVSLRKKLAGINFVESSRFDFPGSFNYVRGLYTAGLSLTRIQLSSDGSVSFSGKSQSAPAVSAFVAALSSDRILQGVKLSSLRLSDDGTTTFNIDALYGTSSAKTANNQ